jgi:hypothetical protein
MNHPDEQRLIEYAGGDAPNAAGAREVEQHLLECAVCRQSVETLRRVLAAASAVEVPEPDAGYEARMWRRVAGKLEPRVRRAGWREWFSVRRLVPAGAVAMLALAAFLAGRFWPRPGGNEAGRQAENVSQVRERILLVAVGDHLDRAQSILLEIANAEPGEATGEKNVDISREQRRAEDLLGANRLYRQTAQRTGDATVADVLGELEPLLVELANSPSEVPASELESLRRRIEARGLLLKVRVVSSNVHERERTPPGSPKSL